MRLDLPGVATGLLRVLGAVGADVAGGWCALRGSLSVGLAASRGEPVLRRPRMRPWAERLETRRVLQGSVTTYTWVALGDGASFNDASNWSHPAGGAYGNIGISGVPTLGSNIYFPPPSTLPANSPTTINFNAPGINVGLFTIAGSYTFTGNGVSVGAGIIVTTPPGGSPVSTTLELASVNMSRQTSFYVQSNASLSLGDADDLTGLQLRLQGGVTSGGGGNLLIDTSNVNAPINGLSLQTFEVQGGTVTLGTTMSLSSVLFQVDQGAGLNVADDAAPGIGSLTGGGAVDLEGTTAADDTTALTAYTPNGESDDFTGTIAGTGTFTLSGHGTLTVSGISFGGTGSVDASLGTLDVDGPLSAASLEVGDGGTLGGVGSWSIAGPVVFQAGATFDVTLDGLDASSQYTQLTSTDSTDGINLGLSTLAGSVNYEYQAGDTFAVASAPVISGAFQNVTNGMVLLDGSIPFSVTQSATAVTLTALQSETTTQLSSSARTTNPGQAVTFTANVSTRTAPVTGGTVSFEQNGNVLATEPVESGGTATYTTTSLPLGSSTIAAVYSGVSNILGSTSPSVTQTVVPYTTVTTLTSSANPSRTGQPVTLTATVTADGAPVTGGGTITFTRGSQRLGTASLGSSGTASITVSNLPQGDVRIQAAFTGNPDDFGSVSGTFIQAVDRFDTATTLTTTTVTRPNGKIREALEAAVTAIDVTGVTPTGTVVFRRNGRVIGRTRAVNGTATFLLPGGIPARGRFVAQFQASKHFGASKSAPIILPA